LSFARRSILTKSSFHFAPLAAIAHRNPRSRHQVPTSRAPLPDAAPPTV
jgi:hypothetical protein